MVAKTVMIDYITIDEYRQVSEMLESIGVPVMLEAGRLIKRVSTKDWHSIVTGIIHSFIQMHLITNDLPGIVTGETTGYAVADDDCPEPDVAYCAVLNTALDTPCIPEAPTLVVEVVSDPSNKRELERLDDKRAKYLALGATVWDVWAKAREVKIYVPGQAEPTIERDTLTFAGLPGLEIPLKVVFAKLPKEEDTAQS